MTTTAELFAQTRAEALNEESDPEAYWALVSALQDRDPTKVWALVAPLATEEDLRLQLLVPDVLRRLGHEAQPLALQTLELFAQMVAAGPAAELLACIGEACVEFHDVSVVKMLAPHAGHLDDAVREAVLHALRRSNHPEAIAALISLSRDAVEDLREWATFALGSQLPLVDNEEIRDALAARLTDPHEPTRDEAVIGLGLRADPRALGPLLAQLERGFAGQAMFEAARALASPRLHGALMALQLNPRVLESLTEEERAELAAALAACS